MLSVLELSTNQAPVTTRATRPSTSLSPKMRAARRRPRRRPAAADELAAFAATQPTLPRGGPGQRRRRGRSRRAGPRRVVEDLADGLRLLAHELDCTTTRSIRDAHEDQPAGTPTP